MWAKPPWQLPHPTACLSMSKVSVWEQHKCLLDLGIKVDPGAIGFSKGRPVGSDGASVLHHGEGNAGGVGGSWQCSLQC